jgi:hypothetical protein
VVIILKLECFAVYNIRLKFQQVFFVFGVVARFFVFFAGEFFDALVTVPFRDRPEMAFVAIDAAQDLDA